MFEFIRQLYSTVVYLPELNILYFFYKLTGDVGVAIILLAAAVNLAILPLFAKNYINMQKTKLLQPQIKEIQAKYKKDPKVMLEKMREFNLKHGLSSGSIFLVLIVQLVFVTGLYWVIDDVVKGEAISGLYAFVDGGNLIADFKNSNGESLAFGLINVGASASSYLWLPFASSFLSYLYGMYTFKWAPKVDLPPLKTTKKKDGKAAENSWLDPEAMQQSMQFQSIYVMPIILFVIQYTLPVGLNLYFATSSAISLIRQIFLTNYYASHTEKLAESIVKSDPINKDNDPTNDLEFEEDNKPVTKSKKVKQESGAIIKSKKKPKNKKKAS